MNFYVFCSLLTAITSLGLCLFVFWRNPGKQVNQAFSLWTFGGFIWAIGYWKMIVVPGASEALFWWREAHAGAIFIPVFFVHLVCALLEKTASHRKLLWGAYAFGLFLEGMNFTPYFISGVAQKLQFAHYLVPGPLYHLFFLFFFACVIYGHLLMFQTYRNLPPHKRNQVKYFLIASIVAFGGGSTTFSLVYDIPIPPVGVFLIPTFTFILAYAIVKHRLMDINVVIQKGVVYSLITLFLATFFMVSFVLFQRYFSATLNVSTVGFVALMSLVLALSFQPVLTLFQKGVERFLFPKKFDVPTAFRKASESIVSVLDLQKLLNYILEMISSTLEVEQVALYLLDDEGKKYKRVAVKEPAAPAGRPLDFLPSENALVWKLRESGDPFLREDLAAQSGNRRWEEVREMLEATQTALAMPLFFRSELVGILMLGEKTSLGIFTALDLELLSAFSNQAIVAIENAKLFNQLNGVKNYNENILRSMTSGVITVDTHSRITKVNEAAERLLGKKTKELVDRNTSVLGGSLATLIEKTLANGSLFFGEELELTQNKKPGRVVAVSTAHLLDTQQEKVGVIAVLNDITQMRELQKQVRQAEKLATIGTMAAGLAHEIKNPLVAVKTFMDLLPTKFQDVEFRENFSELVKQEVQRINEIVTHLLDFAHPKQPVFEPVSVAEVLNGTLDLLSLQAKDSRVELAREIPDSLPLVSADREELNRVFMNIVLNGIQAMHKGGQIKVRAEKRGDSIAILFQDTGPGIPPENLQRIFDPFFSTKHKGTGLGLTICQKIIQDHKGDIQVQSTPAGTTFQVILPFLKT